MKEKKIIGKAKISMVSDVHIVKTLIELKDLVNKIDAKEKQSISRGLWNYISKKPIIGKESVTKKIMRKVGKGK